MRMIHFPWMHPEGAGDIDTQGVQFLDPGLGMADAEQRFWAPDGLPLGRDEARSYLNEVLRFGETFRDPKDLARIRSWDLEDFFTETSQALASELSKRLKEGDGAAEEEATRALQGQMVLLLNWMLEEDILESREMEQGYRRGVSQLRQIMGIEEEEAKDFLELEGAAVEASEGHYSRWPGLAPWFFLFLPAESALHVVMEPIRQELKDNGLEWMPLSEVSGYRELKRWTEERGLRAELAQGPGWRLALKNRPDRRMPWLDREFPVLFIRR